MSKYTWCYVTVFVTHSSKAYTVYKIKEMVDHSNRMQNNMAKLGRRRYLLSPHLHHLLPMLLQSSVTTCMLNNFVFAQGVFYFIFVLAEGFS